MSQEHHAIRIGWLLLAVLAYAAASLFHHVHNAEFLDEYPNMPAWLSRAWVYAAWCGVTAVGVAGLALVRGRHRIAGLAVLGVYAAFGLDGLGHYVVAPVSAHTATASASIWLEVATALLLLAVVATLMLGAWNADHQAIDSALDEET